MAISYQEQCQDIPYKDTNEDHISWYQHTTDDFRTFSSEDKITLSYDQCQKDGDDEEDKFDGFEEDRHEGITEIRLLNTDIFLSREYLFGERNQFIIKTLRE